MKPPFLNKNHWDALLSVCRNIQKTSTSFFNLTLEKTLEFLVESKLIEKNHDNSLVPTELGELVVEQFASESDSQKDEKANYTEFDEKISKHFFKMLSKYSGLRNLPKWKEGWAVEIRKLREIDGYQKNEIVETLAFIAKDNREGFCFSKNIVSLLSIRKKWKNDRTKFDTAFEAMLEAKESSADSFPFERNTKNKREARCNDFFEFLLECRTPAWNSQKEKRWRTTCLDVGLLMNEFVETRGWPLKTIDDFKSRIEEVNSKTYLTPKVLLNELKLFFSTVSQTGFYRQREHGEWVLKQDENYMGKIIEFINARENNEK